MSVVLRDTRENLVGQGDMKKQKVTLWMGLSSNASLRSVKRADT